MSRPVDHLGWMLLVSTAVAVAETVTLGALGVLAQVPVPLVDAGLLLLATTHLGAVWALRSHVRDKSTHAPLSAALVPVIATALFVLPRLISDEPGAAWLTLASSALFSLGIERVWTSRLSPDRPVDPFRRAHRVATPVSTVGLVLASLPGNAAPLIGGALLLAAAALGAMTLRRIHALERQARTFARHLRRIEVGGSGIIVPPSPGSEDPWLREVDRRLRRRASEVANLTEQDARARRQIASARELRTRFMASMSHELRSPLNSIVGFAQLLDEEVDGPLSEGQRESVTMIRRSAEELIRLLTDVLDLARLEAGKLRLDRRWVPSVELLTEAVSRGEAIVEGREVEIEAELQPGLPPVLVDRRRILQAVLALFRHAAATLERTRIRMRTRIAPGPPGPHPQLRIELYDAVGAIAPDEVARIFEAFREITEPTGRRVGGLGMSLSLARELVREHGGDVWADSVRGAGTILCVALPLEEEDTSERRSA